MCRNERPWIEESLSFKYGFMFLLLLRAHGFQLSHLSQTNGCVQAQLDSVIESQVGMLFHASVITNVVVAMVRKLSAF